MSDDLIERLRERVAYDELWPDRGNMLSQEQLFDEAANEIERLREALDGVQFALGQEPPHVTSAWLLARGALGPREALNE